VQSLADRNKVRFHLPDGPAQRERDEQMAAGGTDFSIKAVEWIYAHDPRELPEAAGADDVWARRET
jgi:salicylate hydroxylase